MSRPVRPFLGESAESRVNARRRLLLDKAFALMATDQWRDCSIAQLCRDAELNKRYFYESFQSLDALENAVVDDLTAALLDLGWKTVAEAQQMQMDTPALARHVLKACISWLVEDNGRAKILFGKASDNPYARLHREQVIAQLAQVLSSFGMAYHHPRQPRIEITPEHHTLAKLSAALLIGGTIESILAWINGGLDMSLDEFADYIARFWVVLGDAAVTMATASKP